MKELAAKLFCGIVSDVLDDMGHTSSVPPPVFQPCFPGAKAWGPARTIVLAPLDEGDDPELVHGGLPLLDTINPGEVSIVGGASMEWAYWGELMSNAAKYRGASGVVVDGMSRDTVAVRELGFPLFARGRYGKDIRGRGKVAAIDVPTTVAGVPVEPGQWVLAEEDGVAVIPKGAEEDFRVRIEAALSVESDVVAAIHRGVKPSDLVKEFGVL